MYLNNTENFYKSNDASLFYEMTICQCLNSLESPYMETLQFKITYGELIGNFLKKFCEKPKIIVEAGGGYGTLMKNFLKEFCPEKVYMVDISKKFLNIQKKTLKEYKNIEYINTNIYDFLEDFNKHIDIFLCNEVIGDLETVVGVKKDNFKNIHNVDISYLPETFNINTGAIKLVEKLRGKVSVAFLSEHSSTYEIPEKFKDILFDGKKSFSPEEIVLKGHSEYTINFKMLEEIAKKLAFKTIRKHLMEILPLKNNNLIRFVLLSGSHQTDLHEIIDEFYNHVKEYEFLILLR